MQTSAIPAPAFPIRTALAAFNITTDSLINWSKMNIANNRINVIAYVKPGKFPTSNGG